MNAFNPDIYKGNIVMSRVRLARNLRRYPFKINDPNIAKDIVKQVNRALVKADTFNLYFMSNMSEIKLEAMKERHLISQNLIDNRSCGAALINQDESVSVMVNEEDHLRIQSILPGLSLEEAYKNASRVEKRLDEEFDFETKTLTAIYHLMPQKVKMF